MLFCGHYAVKGKGKDNPIFKPQPDGLLSESHGVVFATAFSFC
jgi:hypothetical protein